MDSLRFGTAGIPLSTPKPTIQTGIAHVGKLGLEAMELEFVHSVNVSKEKAPDVKKTAKDNDVVLTCHGQYYINLNSQEQEKQDASVQRILNAARIASMCGAYSVCFHPAFYMKENPEAVYKKVKEALQHITRTLKQEGRALWVRPETMGRATQFGTLQETLKLSQDVEQVMPCIDFSHIHARDGKHNTHAEFSTLLSQVEKALGKEGLQNMHCHVSGIAYGEKGEKNHLVLKESDFKYAELLKAFKDYKVKGVVICESPNIEQDALLLQKTFNVA